MSGVIPGTKFVKICAGHDFMLALTEEGFLYAWGSGANGQTGQGDSGSAGRRNVPTLVSFGDPTIRIKYIAANSSGHVIVVDTGGRLWGWGLNDYGQVGDGTTTRRTTPQRLMSGSTLTFDSVVIGRQHSIAMTGDGKIFAWGRNTVGQVGIGSTVGTIRIPTAVTPSVTYKAIAAGERTSMAICENGFLYMWGSNAQGQFGNGLSGTGAANNVRVPSLRPFLVMG